MVQPLKARLTSENIRKAHKIITSKRTFLEYGPGEVVIYQHGFVGWYLFILSMVREKRR